MMYLIGQLAIWLLLTAAFAALAGWAFAAERAASGEEASRRERENLLRDLVRFNGDDGREHETELDAAPNERLLAIRNGRIAELERALETARARADELGGQLAEQQRRGQINNPDAEELARLRAVEAERERTVDAEAAPVEDENVVLQAWRLRYFEQRVNYLEGQARDAAPELSLPAPAETPLTQEWIAREATARAAFLENELRALQPSAASASAAPSEDAEPFAADADVDALLRWRLLYLERRVAHLQSETAAAPAPAAPQPPVAAAADPDRWRWRAHYLEARVRHLEQRPAAPALSLEKAPASAPIQETAAPAPRPVALSKRAKPPVLASARNGAPDDLTLIEGVSLLQQTTLYSLGIFHFDQIAAWTDEHVAWVDQYLRLQGRIGEEEWLEQAGDLARDGPAAARRAFEDEDA